MKETIRRQARDLGFDDCRFTTAAAPGSAPQFQSWLSSGCHGQMQYLERGAAKRSEPKMVLPGAKTILSLASSYYQTDPGDEPPAASASTAGIVARYARHRDYHDVLGEQLRRLSEVMSRMTDPPAQSLWYVDTGPLLERDLGQRAGLGFVGKHTNLISRHLGNWFFLSEILTTLELPPDLPETNRCGTCTRCMAACPTNAITAPFQLDARRCISYLTIELKGSIPKELRPAIGNRIFGCDDCLAVCPWNRFAREGQLMKRYRRPELATPDLIELLSLDESEFKRRFAGTPILRTKRRGLLRNVCVALGNIGDAIALPALMRAAADPEPLIAEHATWAIERIRRRCEPPGRCVDTASVHDSDSSLHR